MRAASGYIKEIKGNNEICASRARSTKIYELVCLLYTEIVEEDVFRVFEVQRVLFVFRMAFHGTHFKHEIREFDVADMMFGQRLDDWIAAADGMDAAQRDVADIIDGFVVGQIDAEDIEARLRFDVAKKHILNGEWLDFRVGRRGVLIARWVALVLTERLDARRCDIDADPAVADDEIAEGAVAHEIVMRPADADAVARTLQHAICDGDVLTGLRLVELLLHAADDYAVIAICEIAVADDDVTA